MPEPCIPVQPELQAQSQVLIQVNFQSRDNSSNDLGDHTTKFIAIAPGQRETITLTLPSAFLPAIQIRNLIAIASSTTLHLN